MISIETTTPEVEKVVEALKKIQEKFTTKINIIFVCGGEFTSRCQNNDKTEKEKELTNLLLESSEIRFIIKKNQWSLEKVLKNIYTKEDVCIVIKVLDDRINNYDMY